MSIWRPINREPIWKRLLPVWLHPWVRWLTVCVALAVLAAAGLAFFYFSQSMRFDIDEVARMPAGTVFHDRHGREILLAGGGSPRQADRADIPDFLVKCLLAREDARFYQHSGVDPRGLLRATARNIRDRDYTQGASTITMQLARNSFDGMRGKTLHRKLLEIALTLRIESHHTKDEILTHYLNRIYFGAGAYGVEQAARVYFGLPVAELNEAECALIVGIIRGPHVFSPFRNPGSAFEQRDQTLARMVASGIIDSARRDAILAQNVRLLDEADREAQASYALHAIRRELDVILDRQPGTGAALHVHTTLDTDWQARLERDIGQAISALEREPGWAAPMHRDHVRGEETGYLQYAAVTLETRTGEAMAWIGGRDISHSGVDRARARRDLGGAVEPIVAAAAAERGKLVLVGRPIQTGRQIGALEVERVARRCGIGGPFAEGEDLFRGWVGATPLESATALATLGNKGQRPRPHFIREVRDASGNTIFRAEPSLSPAITAQAAAEALRVFQTRSGSRCFTGFTGSERDAWAMRIGPGGSTIIWIGFDQPQAIASPARLGKLLDDLTDSLVK